MSDSQVCTLIHDRDGNPKNAVFDDYYFSSDDGIAESKHVYIQGNELVNRFQNLPQNTAFTILETGFGSGLNFLVTCNTWLGSANPSNHLTYIAIEKYPLTQQQIRTTLLPFNSIANELDQLTACYPICLPGMHSLHVLPNVTLLLLIDDIENALTDIHSSYNHRIDAFYLDGFSPAKNPAMWQQDVIDNLAELASPNSSLATFTAATEVRKKLKKAGFEVKKRVGFGKKREMITANYEPQIANTSATCKTSAHTWDRYPETNTLPSDPRTILIVGAGLAGAHIAYKLASYGFRVKVVDTCASPAAKASGNSQGVLYTRLSLARDPLPEFALHSYLYALRWYQSLFDNGLLCEGYDGELKGCLQLAINATIGRNHKKLADQLRDYGELAELVNQYQASALAGTTLQHNALHLQKGGWINPRSLVEKLLDHPNIQYTGGYTVENLQRENGVWRVFSRDNTSLTADIVVVATAQNVEILSDSKHYPIKSVKGQVSIANSTKSVGIPVCHEGYIAPAIAGHFSFGATYHLHSLETSITPHDHQTNILQQQKYLSDFSELHDSAYLLQGRSGIRATTPDYLPLVGQVPDIDGFMATHSTLPAKRKHKFLARGSYLSGLYMSSGYGSRGLTYSPLASEYLCNLILGRPCSLNRRLDTALNPARFLVRQLAKPK